MSFDIFTCDFNWSRLGLEETVMIEMYFLLFFVVFQYCKMFGIPV